MNKNILRLFIISFLGLSITNAQSTTTASNTKTFTERVYCGVVSFFGKSCEKNLITQNLNSTSTTTSATTTNNSKVETKTLNNKISTDIASINPISQIQYIYLKGEKGERGESGTTTIIYQSPNNFSTAGSYLVNPNTNVIQTTVPSEIYQTFVKFFTSEKATISDLTAQNIVTNNLTATNTNSLNIIGENATVTNTKFVNSNINNATIANANITNSNTLNSTNTNLFATSSILVNSTSTNLFSQTASITNATSSNLFANIFTSLTSYITNLLFDNATGTNITATGTAILTNILNTNATSTNFFANSLNSLNSTSSNLFANNSVFTNATSTNLFSQNLSANNATSTNFFANTLSAINSIFTNILFNNATGTNISIRNLNATGTALIENLSATNTLFANATITNLLVNNATNTLLTVATITTDRIQNATGTLFISTKNSNKISLLANNAEGLSVNTNAEVSIVKALGIGRSNPSAMLHVGSSTVASGTTVAIFSNAGGDCNITPNVVGGITCTSDERLKKAISNPASSALDKINQINVKEYLMNTDLDSDNKKTGFIAQQIESIFPSLVITDGEGFKSVSYAGFIPFVIQSIQEMQNKFFSKEIQTEKLCIGNTCINESDLQDFLKYKTEIENLKQGQTTQTP